jgi:ADP-ribose pyrophosphatase
MNSYYKINNKKKLHDGFFKLHEFNFNHKKHNGEWNNNVKREVFSGAHVGALLPYDPVKKKIILINQFRPGLFKREKKPLTIEISAGIIDEGETPLETAKRECMEETGCRAENILEICSYYPAPGSSESYYHVYLGEVSAFEGERIMGQEHENEDILVKSYDVYEVKELLKQNKIINGLTLIALQWFFLEYYKS